MYQTVQEMLAIREQSIKRHEAFLRDLPEDLKGTVAQLIENQERLKLLREADVTTTDVPTSVFPVKYAFPLIVQVFPAVVAAKLFQVQPMSAPTGKVFYKGYIHQGDSTSFAHSGSYASSTEGGSVKRGKLRFTSLDISAVKHILQAQWSTEVSEDMRALANVQVETDLMNALRDEIVGELDWLILKDIMDQSAELAGTVTAPAFGDYSYQSHIEHYDEVRNSLIDADVKVSEKRFRRTDFVVGQPAAVAKLRKSKHFRAELAGGDKVGSQRVGTLDQWEVWENANFPQANRLLCGIKGEGYVFAPYIPMELMPAMYESATDEWVRNIRTRAGRKLVIPKSFAIVDLSNLA